MTDRQTCPFFPRATSVAPDPPLFGISSILSSLCSPCAALAVALLGATLPAAPQVENLEVHEKERETWQNVGEIFDLIGITEGTRVADVGAGAGFFTVRLARAVGASGKVHAVEIDEERVRELRDRVSAASLANVEVLLGRAEDPGLSTESLDAVLVVNTYHEMTEPQEMLEHIRAALKPGGRLLLTDPFDPEHRDDPREAQVEKHNLAPELAEDDLRRAGFEILARNDEFIIRRGSGEVEWLILARRPDR